MHAHVDVDIDAVVSHLVVLLLLVVLRVGNGVHAIGGLDLGFVLLGLGLSLGLGHGELLLVVELALGFLGLLGGGGGLLCLEGELGGGGLGTEGLGGVVTRGLVMWVGGFKGALGGVGLRVGNGADSHVDVSLCGLGGGVGEWLDEVGGHGVRVGHGNVRGGLRDGFAIGGLRH